MSGYEKYAELGRETLGDLLVELQGEVATVRAAIADLDKQNRELAEPTESYAVIAVKLPGGKKPYTYAATSRFTGRGERIWSFTGSSVSDRTWDQFVTWLHQSHAIVTEFKEIGI